MTETRLTDRLAVKTAAFVLAVLLSVAALVGIGGTAAVLLLAGGRTPLRRRWSTQVNGCCIGGICTWSIL